MYRNLIDFYSLLMKDNFYFQEAETPTRNRDHEVTRMLLEDSLYSLPFVTPYQNRVRNKFSFNVYIFFSSLAVPREQPF